MISMPAITLATNNPDERASPVAIAAEDVSPASFAIDAA
jgi:hypothetical protein